MALRTVMFNILALPIQMLALTAFNIQEQSLFEMREGEMSEVRSFAEVVNAVIARTLSAMGKSQTGAMSRNENDAKRDNERDGREYDRRDTMPRADIRHLRYCRILGDSQDCSRFWVIHALE